MGYLPKFNTENENLYGYILFYNYLTKTPNPISGWINPSRISPTHIPRIISDMPGKNICIIKYILHNWNLDICKHFSQNQKQHNSAKIINRADKNWAHFRIFNRSSRRKKGITSNLLFIIPDFFCIFPMKCYGNLRFEGNGKIPLGRYGKKIALSKHFK